MVRAVTKYITEGGMEFDTEEEALLYEAAYKIRDELKNDLYGNTSLSSTESREVATYIVENYDITKKEI